MQSPTIPCRSCQGKGRRFLSAPLQRVFDIIKELGQPTCPEIFEKLKRDYQDRTVAPIYVKRLLKLQVITKVSVKGERTPRYAAV